MSKLSSGLKSIAGPLLGSTPLGSVIGAAGSLLGGIGGKQAADAQASADQANAAVIENRTQVELTQQQRRAYQSQGTTAAQFGSAGLVQTGSVGDVMRMNARNAAFDAASIQTQGALEANAARMAGKSASAQGTGSLISGGIKAASKLFG